MEENNFFGDGEQLQESIELVKMKITLTKLGCKLGIAADTINGQYFFD